MMVEIICVFVGMLIGATLGILALALCHVSSS